MSEPTLTEVMAAIHELKGMLTEVQSATTTQSREFREFKDHVFEGMDKLGTRVKALEVELEVSVVRPMNGANRG